jgi:hypothetical protein
MKGILRTLVALATAVAILAPIRPAAADVVIRGKRCTTGNELARCVWVNYRTTDKTLAARGTLQDHNAGQDELDATVWLERLIAGQWEIVPGSSKFGIGTDSLDISGDRVNCRLGAQYRAVIYYVRFPDGYAGVLASYAAVQC